jgi:hypothetical protein
MANQIIRRLITGEFFQQKWGYHWAIFYNYLVIK